MEVHAATKHVRTVRQSSGHNFGDAERRFVFSARHFDLVVVGRRTKLNGPPPNLIERILLGCGRPFANCAAATANLVVGTVMVCRKETAEPARGTAAAMPLLVNAKQVVLAGAKERDPSLGDGLADLFAS